MWVRNGLLKNLVKAVWSLCSIVVQMYFDLSAIVSCFIHNVSQKFTKWPCLCTPSCCSVSYVSIILLTIFSDNLQIWKLIPIRLLCFSISIIHSLCQEKLKCVHFEVLLSWYSKCLLIFDVTLYFYTFHRSYFFWIALIFIKSCRAIVAFIQCFIDFSNCLLFCVWKMSHFHNLYHFEYKVHQLKLLHHG